MVLTFAENQALKTIITNLLIPIMLTQKFTFYDSIFFYIKAEIQRP